MDLSSSDSSQEEIDSLSSNSSFVIFLFDSPIEQDDRDVAASFDSKHTLSLEFSGFFKYNQTLILK